MLMLFGDKTEFEGLHCQLRFVAWLLLPVSTRVSSWQMFCGFAAIAFVRSKEGTRFTESVIRQPNRLIVGWYVVGTVGKTMGEAVDAPMMLDAGCQVNVPPLVPAAVSCRLSSPQ